MHARRVARDKLGMEVSYLEQLYTFSGRRRDPRGWSIAVAYLGLVPSAHLRGEVLRDVLPVDRLPPLPFDHGTIAARAVRRLRDKSSGWWSRPGAGARVRRTARRSCSGWRRRAGCPGRRQAGAL